MDTNLLEAVCKDANCFKKFELEIRIKGNTQGQNVGHNFVAEVMLLICAGEHGEISTKSSKAKLICFC